MSMKSYAFVGKKINESLKWIGCEKIDKQLIIGTFADADNRKKNRK